MPASICGACASEASRLDIDGAQIQNIDVGVQFDDGTHFVATEYAKARTDNYVVLAKSGGYVTYGRRFGNLMPYATYAFLHRDEVTESNAIPASGPLAGLNAAINGVLAAGNGDQDSYSVGVRYELPSFSVLTGALVKLQLDHIDAKDGNGMLNHVQPAFDGKLNMVSASFDFIF